jgi:hypothetical protein
MKERDIRAGFAVHQWDVEEIRLCHGVLVASPASLG